VGANIGEGTIFKLLIFSAWSWYENSFPLNGSSVPVERKKKKKEKRSRKGEILGGLTWPFKGVISSVSRQVHQYRGALGAWGDAWITMGITIRASRQKNNRGPWPLPFGTFLPCLGRGGLRLQDAGNRLADDFFPPVPSCNGGAAEGRR